MLITDYWFWWPAYLDTSGEFINGTSGHLLSWLFAKRCYFSGQDVYPQEVASSATGLDPRDQKGPTDED